MGPKFIVALVLAVVSFSSAALIFWDKPSKSFVKRSEWQTPIEIKWGEGSEAGVPDAAAQK